MLFSPKSSSNGVTLFNKHVIFLSQINFFEAHLTHCRDWWYLDFYYLVIFLQHFVNTSYRKAVLTECK